MNTKLSLLDDSSDSEVELNVNKSYANFYNQWRNKEELQKYKDLKKDEEDSESSSESEDDIPEFDEEFFRALSLLKSKDSRLYDKNFELFKQKEIVKTPKAVKQKRIYMKDYERNLVLEKAGKFSDEEDEGDAPEEIPTYDEEQEELKKSFKAAAGVSSDSESDADDLLKVRKKTKKEEEAEDAAYVKWLKGEAKEVSDDVKKDLSCLRDYWNDPKLDEGEKFLRDYILNKKYLEKDDSEIPTFEELTSGMLSDDEKMLNEIDTFERKYNFRFEEPDEEFIKRYPRTIGDSLRNTDNRRKQKREEKAERKRKEREQRREELKRLKALKRKEIEEKFLQLKEISGQDEINLNESDIESDFDPDKHDKKMNEMFNDEYYSVEENQKPEFPYDEELDSENWNKWSGQKIIDDNDEDVGEENCDASENKSKSGENSQGTSNFKEEFANEMIFACQPKKRVKKKSLFAKIISQPKPIYDPSGKSFEDYLDEYYRLDYEDIIGDMPVRYKYRKVVPNDFGLTVDEILKADDKELNRWCSVKKTCQFRKDEEELYDVQAFQKKAQIPQIKEKMLPSVYAIKEVDNCAIDNDNSGLETTEDNIDNAEKLESNLNCKAKNKKYKKVHHNSNNPNYETINSGNTSDHIMEENPSEFNEINTESEQGATIQVCHKKSKKKKHNYDHNSLVIEKAEGCNTLNEEIEEETSSADFKMDRNISSNFMVSNNHKSLKRKKKDSEDDSFVTSAIEADLHNSEDVSPKCKKWNLSHQSPTSPNLVAGDNRKSNKLKRKDSEDVSFESSASESNDKSHKWKRKDSKDVSFECSASESNHKSLKQKRKDSKDVSFESSTSESNHKSHKRKNSEDVSSESSAAETDLGVDVGWNKWKKLSYQSNTSSNSTSNFIPENVSGAPAKRKKKKKKQQEGGISNNVANRNIKQSHNSKINYEQQAFGDKRLGLSDERLAAYGINPKKFKNRIIYSKK